MPIFSIGDRCPLISPSAFVAPNAVLIGDVEVGDSASIWFGAILRGDIERIWIGAQTNVQDGVVMHTDPGSPLEVGSSATIGHQAVLHGCRVGERSVIGIGASILSGAVIGKDCLVGAGALVTEGRIFPDRSLIIGLPAKLARTLTDAEVAELQVGTHDYLHRREIYQRELKSMAPRRTDGTVTLTDVYHQLCASVIRRRPTRP